MAGRANQTRMSSYHHECELGKAEHGWINRCPGPTPDTPDSGLNDKDTGLQPEHLPFTMAVRANATANVELVAIPG